MKRQLLSLFLLLMLGGLAFGQSADIPVCNGTNGPNCTDYFGSGNWANSPLPAGTITGYTLIAGGSGYTAPAVIVTDVTGATLSGASAPTPIVTGGVITGFTGGTGLAGYTAPVITITDTTGSGAMASAIIGPPFAGGIKKFQDALVDLKTVLATPDPNAFAGSDYYEIALVQYTQSLSPSNLPATTLRGYVQVPTGSAGCTAASAAAPKYLGPVILAQKGRPVRVKFTNCLASGTGGNLFIPVDTTYMGAGMNANGPAFTQNRATLHLHGGATPWISDGTPHQWTTPAGDAQKGNSVAYVPDMWFDASGAIIPSCAGQSTCGVTGASNNPGAGSLSFFWTNDQGARLMFYHDHAYGLTRLNVYAGEAAGYVLYDPTEENTLAAGTAPGTLGNTPDAGHFIPLVIQDKTFVPSAGQIGAQDPTWAANFGTTPGIVKTGDLWFPHVYMPNQNPNDPLGANSFGRWDYGPWFFPPQTTLTAGPITTTCTSAAFPGLTLAPTQSCPSCGCPITPNPSGTPEAFMDTPVVNGVAYPVLHVAPAAYRFKILSAGNDRSWNLSWFVADSTQGNTEVAMLPAAPPSAGSAVPLCTAINPVAVPSLDLGLVTALFDNAGNPLNGTGLPAGCWPNYGPQQGIPAPQTMWAADGRAGGAPDPRNAGPAWIEIGSEGGLLPAPVVIPATPVNYEQNVRSITIGSVAMHGLWLGPAERADVIVDFSQFSGKTLILYNDAPTPAPASDSRVDYFTGDGDQSAIGGAPNTPAGYGPNTRTIMQVVVDGTNPNAVPFSLTALKSAFASTATTQGVFATTQPTIIVPEPAYNSAYNGSFPPTYASIQSTTLTFTPTQSLTFDQSCGGNGQANSPQCDIMGQKTIQELFTLDYGRMNATLGTELPNVNFTNQTTIPLAYVDPATEIIRQGNTQLWKITHNGVDTHFIHFHLFNVQVINRVGWDGSVRPIDANEAGWKDTVRMNPLEDITVALQPITPATPFPLANSVRLLDVTTAPGTGGPFSNLNPYTNAGVTTSNELQNFGWEYVWHCHILGHEENDMMRPIIFQVPPQAPSNLVASVVNGVVNLAFTDNSANETGFAIQRSTDPNFVNPAPVTIAVGASTARNAAGEGTDWGTTIFTTDSSAPLGTNYYRVQAVDDGWKGIMSQTYNEPVLGSSATCGAPPPAGTPVVVGNCPLVSAFSNTASVGLLPNASVSPIVLTFTSATLGTTSASQGVTVSNTGGAPLGVLSITFTGANPGDFLQTNNCITVAAGSNCTISVSFKPTALGARSAALSISTNDPSHPTLGVTLSGTGIGPVAVLSPLSVSFGNQLVGTTSAVRNVTLTNAGSAGSILNINTRTITGANAGDFSQTNTCGTTLAAGASCSFSIAFRPTAVGARGATLSVSTSDLLNPTVTSQFSGTGTAPIAVVSPTTLNFGNQKQQTTSAAQTVTLSNTGTAQLTINSIAIGGTNAGDFSRTTTCGVTLAAGSSCTISVTFKPTKKGTRTGTLTLTDNSNAVASSQLVSLSGTGQ